MEEREAITYFKNNPDQIAYVDCEGDTHLHLATKAGDSDTVEFLINNGINVNAVNKFGDTPILMVQPDDGEMRKVVDLLIREGANITHKNRRGVNALILFRRRFMRRNKKWFGREVCRGLRHLDMTDIDMAILLREAKWPIRCAVWTRKPSVTDLMIQMGDDVNATDAEGYSALFEAAAIRDCAHVALLISRGANIHQKTSRWGNALSVAVMSGVKGTSNIRIMSMLMDEGLDPNEVMEHTDYDVASPFHLALVYGSRQTVDFLVNHGGDLQYIDLKGRSALHLAACNTNPEVINIVGRSHIIANWDIRTYNGHNAFHFAAWGGNTVVFDILYNNGTNIDGRTEHGITPLMYALMGYVHRVWSDERRSEMKKKFASMVKLLLNYGADVDAETVLGHTPLLLAYTKFNVARILLRKIAHLNIMGRPVTQKNMRLINGSNVLRDYFDRCSVELTKMKDCHVHDDLDMLSILNGTNDDFAQWGMDDQMLKAFSQKIIEFPLYKRTIEEKFCKPI